MVAAAGVAAVMAPQVAVMLTVAAKAVVRVREANQARILQAEVLQAGVLQRSPQQADWKAALLQQSPEWAPPPVDRLAVAEHAASALDR